MIFASPIFLLVFLPLVLIGYLLIPRKVKNIFLLISSIVFYSWGAPKFIFAILITTTIDFFLARLIYYSNTSFKRKIALTFSIVMNVGFLFYFKYCNFFIENLNNILSAFNLNGLPVLNVVLPIGISFYTFESITYLVDIYRRIHKPLNNFWDYQLYILFFPKLIAGPITRYHEIADQITERFNSDVFQNIIFGFSRFCLGLAKKVLLANTIGEYADFAFNDNSIYTNSSLAWMASIAYTLQIYFDFSGYSDMAIGLGKMFGFDLPENFNFPYISKSITEFWRRWHMTLGNWMKNYLYIPLGGNKVNTKQRLFFNLFLVFLLSGFWHGADWNFIIWGIAHGTMIVIERLAGEEKLSKIPSILRIVLTFLFVNIAWITFRTVNIHESMSIYHSMFSFHFQPIKITNYHSFYLTIGLLLSLGLLNTKYFKLSNYFYEYAWDSKNSIYFTIMAITLFTMSVSFIFGFGFNPFIYFRF
ncbi:MAG: MBOAT family protein [Bacteroidia bacterium]